MKLNSYGDTVRPSEARAGDLWARRALSAPGLVALWVLAILPWLIVVTIAMALEILSEIGVAIEDRSTSGPEDVAGGLVRATLYFLLVAIGAPLMLRKVPGGLLVRWAVGLVLLGCLAGLSLLMTEWSEPLRATTYLLAFWLTAMSFTIALGLKAAAIVSARAWRAASVSGAWALIVGPGGIAMGLGCALLLGMIAVAGYHPDEQLDDVFIPRHSRLAAFGEFVFFAAEDARETHRARSMVPASDRAGPWSTLPWIGVAYAEPSQDRFDFCLLALNRRAEGEPESKLDQAAAFLRRRAGLSFDDARDLAADKSIDVCRSLGRKRGLRTADDVRAYYWKSIQRLRIDQLRRQKREPRTCRLTSYREDQLEDGSWWGQHSARETADCINTARCRLSQDEQDWLNLCVEFATREIELRTNIPKSTASRRCKQAKTRLYGVFSELCR